MTPDKTPSARGAPESSRWTDNLPVTTLKVRNSNLSGKDDEGIRCLSFLNTVSFCKDVTTSLWIDQKLVYTHIHENIMEVLCVILNPFPNWFSSWCMVRPSEAAPLNLSSLDSGSVRPGNRGAGSWLVFYCFISYWGKEGYHDGLIRLNMFKSQNDVLSIFSVLEFHPFWGKVIKKKRLCYRLICITA